ncbi:UDP-N-acetylmuramoyl-tripeptide--D-alanyl-D-alanine ligase [Sideroxydans lithotrophicus]|uniref:UDP-N-acetylmuramoyl-tripeptide--D-alanyl-D-alanine ligase n=1 Tax=Sideroxydans lithotrophicus (strain ES-1) TaxID=580332 RepID=D5CP27_SIDLE|nr:UDP-N-acetylmuramoyl-tripeptide--D-alanyl-D-alanine ligase [Sideroxydans lithotrophicus]ADE12948.1 UDP-N-acetylmuramoylalanyl-D-glutamyl-2,6-diaminopimelate/D-alanyl-D-alanyl ligase [Sideroxydans lithotrophicus ES-1]
MMMLSQAVNALHARMDGADVRFSAVSTDTRTIQQGDLFIALKGENFDGARFVAQAAMAGAVAAVVNRDAGLRTQDSGVPLLFVEDTRLALGELAAYWRAQFDIPLVAITGSNGKTTVKEMLSAILRQKIKDDSYDRSLAPRERVGECDDADRFVLATKGNFNNDIGMPLTLLRLRANHRYAVIEMGMNHPNEIDYLTRIACPDVALVNNATGAHLQGLGTVEGVARAKGEIFAGLKDDGTAVINADDAHAALWRSLAGKHRVLDFSLEHPANIQGKWVVQGYGGELLVRTPAGEMRIVLQVPGEHNARNALAAATAALALQIPSATIVTGLQGFGGVAGRLQRKQAKNGATLIDDTYNANPASMHAALEVLAQAKGKRIFVLGDMGELGEDAAQFHREIGISARELGIERLFALGTLSAEAVREFGAGALHFASVEELNAALDAELDAQTTALIKGSRFMKMERVVQSGALHKEEACCSH